MTNEWVGALPSHSKAAPHAWQGPRQHAFFGSIMAVGSGALDGWTALAEPAHSSSTNCNSLLPTTSIYIISRLLIFCCSYMWRCQYCIQVISKGVHLRLKSLPFTIHPTVSLFILLTINYIYVKWKINKINNYYVASYIFSLSYLTILYRNLH